MGLDPIQHHLTLSIVCAVQASGCFLISRAVARLRSDWLRPMGGAAPLVQDRLVQDHLVQDLASIEPQAHHQFDLQAWDQQFAQVLDSSTDRLPGKIGAGLRDPWEEKVEEDWRVGNSPVENSPVEDLRAEELRVEELTVADPLIENGPVPEPLPKPVVDAPLEQPIALNTLFALTVPQLRSHAKQLGLKNYSRQTKAQLLVAIRRQLEGVA
jgi:Rho termination factor, N-terminal domain